MENAFHAFPIIFKKPASTKGSVYWLNFFLMATNSRSMA